MLPVSEVLESETEHNELEESSLGLRNNMRPILIISGGQTGADQGGLRAAEALGIATGGYAPKNYWTERGQNLKLQYRWGLLEHEHTHFDYAARTEANVKLADATVIFGRRSQGSNLTERLCKTHNKPLIWIMNSSKPSEMMRFKLWLVRNKPNTLNVAGNRESVTPGIEALVEAWLIRALQV